MIIPGVIFGALALVPWIERRLTGDDREHHLLDRPRDAPHRTALGVGLDHVRRRSSSSAARRTSSPARSTCRSGASRRSSRSLLLVAPPLAYLATLAACRALAARPVTRAHGAGGRRRP